MLAATAMVLSIAACNSNKVDGKADGADSTAVAEVPQKPTSAKDLLPSKATVDSVSYLLGIQLGSMIKNYNMGDLNFNMIKKGAADFVASKGNPRDEEFTKQFKVNPEEMNRIMNEFVQKRAEYVGAINKEKEQKFLEPTSRRKAFRRPDPDSSTSSPRLEARSSLLPKRTPSMFTTSFPSPMAPSSRRSKRTRTRSCLPSTGSSLHGQKVSSFLVRVERLLFMSLQSLATASADLTASTLTRLSCSTSSSTL